MINKIKDEYAFIRTVKRWVKAKGNPCFICFVENSKKYNIRIDVREQNEITK